MNSLEDEQSQGRKITICRDMIANTILEARASANRATKVL